MIEKARFAITISRQLGSGGAYIGKQLAEKLNVFYADREIISEAAKQLAVLKEELEARDEKVLSFWQSLLQSYAVAPDAYMPPQPIVPADQELFKTESEIIERIARERSAVIIGRCGFHVLREHPHHVSVFLHAGMSFRKARLQCLYEITEEIAKKMIAESDAERARYNHKFTGKEWTDVRQYNLAFDTGKVGVDKSVELILQYLAAI